MARALNVVRCAGLAVAVSAVPWTAAIAQAPPSPFPAPLTDDLKKAVEEGERLLLKERKFADAYEKFDHVLQMAEDAGDEGTLARAWTHLGGSLWGLGEYEAAVEAEEQAVGYCRRLSWPGCESVALNGIGNALESQSRHAEALAAFERSLQAGPATPALEAQVLANMGLVHRYQGHYREAEALFQRSLAIRRAVGEPAAIGQSLNNLGMLSRATGHFEHALVYYRQSLALRRQAADRQGEAQTLNNMANVHGDLGQEEAAIELYTQAREIAREIGYKAQIAFSEQNIGNTLSGLGRYPDALPHLEAAVAAFRDMDRRSATAATLVDIGALHRNAARLAPARAALEEALAIVRGVGEPQLEGRATSELALILTLQGKPAEALPLLDHALTLVAGVNPDVEFELRANRARALRALGRPRDALDDLRAGAAIVNDMRAGLASDAGKVGLFDGRRAVFEELAELLTEAGRQEDALEVAEAARARAFADLLMQREVATRSAEREPLEKLREALDVAGKAGASPDSVTRALADVRVQSEELASLVAVESPRIPEIRRLIARLGATAVEYLATDGRLLAWLVEPSGTVHAAQVTVTRDRLRDLVARARTGVDDVRGDRASLDAALRELDRLLIEPLARWMPQSPDALVVVVPDPSIALVPLAAVTDRAGHPLVERHTLVVAPALSVFRYTAHRGREHGHGAGSALVVADPRAPPASGLPPLAGGRREGTQVSRALGTNVSLLVGERASEAAVKRLAGGRSVLHFATHGLVSPRRPLDSSLVLAAGEGEDGYLRAAEVFGLELSADLVVLSGCSTGVGPASGDGILGLTRAFMYAGTPSVLVTLWDVSDAATASLMQRFYAGLRGGRSKARALRDAQLALRRRHGHPALWAAFQLVGEP